jgi:TRAP-type C4-dicarboxylate transport system permease small subunit
LTHRAEAGFEPEDGPRISRGPLAPLARAIEFLNAWIVRAGSVALLAASAILTYSVVSRYFFKAATDWQDEAAVFCIVGAVFASSAYVQSRRGHIGIELLAAFLPPLANRIREVLVDIASLAFCTFFAWKSWTLCHEAYLDNRITNSTWGPPLWIPYALMGFGISLLAVQIALQVIAGLLPRRKP